MNDINHEAHEPEISDDELKIPESAQDHSNNTHLTAFLGILIIVLILILAGLFLWNASMTTAPVAVLETPTRPTAEENNEPESTNAEAEVETTAAMSSSNNLDLIENDLRNTEVDTLDQDLNTIENELETNTNTPSVAN